MTPKIKVLILLILILPLPCLAANAGDVVINEIAWMGTVVSTANEWIELYNNTDQEINLTNWTLKATDGKPSISLSGTILAKKYFLIERTDDESIPNIPADMFCSFGTGLNNNGEYLELKDSENNLIDSVDGSNKWNDFGNSETKQIMERTATGWQTSHDAGGTPKAPNSPPSEPEPENNQNEENEPESEPTAEENVSSYSSSASNYPPYAEAGPDITARINQEIVFDGSHSWDPDMDNLDYFWNFGDGATDILATAPHTYAIPGQYIIVLQVSDRQFSSLDSLLVNVYDNSVIISEFTPNPEGKDGTDEWIELYNQSDQAANLTGWQLDDQEGGSKPFVFPQNSFIAPRQFLVFKKPITKLSLNNDEDEIRLIFPSGETASQIAYSGGQSGQSVAFDGLDYFWTKTPTPGLANIISAVSEVKKEKTTANNPAPVVQEPQTPQTLVLDLTEPEKYSSLKGGNQPDIQSQNLLGKIQPLLSKQISAGGGLPVQNNKATFILIISIIISGSIFAAWGWLMMKKIAQR